MVICRRFGDSFGVLCWWRCGRLFEIKTVHLPINEKILWGLSTLLIFICIFA